MTAKASNGKTSAARRSPAGKSSGVRRPRSAQATAQRLRPAVRTARSEARPRRVSQARPGWWARTRLALRTLGQNEPETLGFGLLLVVALILRWWRPDWYAGCQFHPDERWIFGVVSQLSYPEAPTGLQYGTFPMYVLATIKDAVGTAASWFGHFDANQFVIWSGRMLSGLFDLGTLIFTYLLGRRLLPGRDGRRLGLLAAALLTFTVLNIQMAHFFVVDVPLAMLTTAVLYFSAGIAQSGARREYVLAGVCLGLGMATKTSALPVSLAVAAGHILGLLRASAQDRRRRWADLLLAAGVSLAAFAVAMPHAFLDWSRFWSNQNEQRRILVTGEADVPYNRQYLRTAPFLYFAGNMVRYTMGWTLGLLSLLAFLAYPLKGLVVLIRSAARRTWEKLAAGAEREAGLIVVLTFGVAYALVIGNSFAKFNRYLLPLTPVLCLAAARLVMEAHARLSGWGRKLAAAAAAVAVAGAVLWALAFASIYRAEHPWIAASRWMQANIPASMPGNPWIRPTTILNEEWGDDLPVGVAGLASKPFRINKFPVQEPDTPRKREIILAMLQSNDWIVMADTRAHAVYRRLPDRYPINAAYYTLMFQERLGFKLAKDFSNYPRLFGREFPDDAADESFTLYDHPHVFLFQREQSPLSPEELARRLDTATAEMRLRGQAAAARGPAVKRAPAAKAAAPASAGELPTVINRNIGQTQDRPVFVFGRLNSFTAGLAWLLLLEVIGLLALPFTLSLFPRLPDGGAALAKIVGTLVFTWLIWMLVSAGLMPHLQSTTMTVLLLLGGGAAYWAWRRRAELREYAARRGALWLTAEIIFAAAFVGYMLTKLYNPDIHNPFGQGYNGGGEPMGMTFFTSVYKSIHFPPYDPWLSGYHINYYYYGHVILGILAKLIGVPPAWSYNIAVSLLFALLVTGLYGLGLGLTGKRRWGAVAAVAGACLGNLHAFFYLLEPLNRVNFTDGLRVLGPWLQDTIRHAGRFEFIWNSTRLIKGTINEMPWFSFLYGDLHAHIIAMPYSLPLIAWALNLLLEPPAPKTIFPEAAGRTAWERGLKFGVAALCLGSLSAINTWNFPPYALLVLGVLVIRAFQNAGRPGLPWAGLGHAALGWLRLVLAGLLLMYFFHRYFVPQSTSLAFVNPAVRTRIKEFLVFFGLPVFMLVSFWAVSLIPAGAKWLKKMAGPARSNRPPLRRLLAVPQAFWSRQPKTFYTLSALLVVAGLLCFFDQVLLALLLALLLCGGYVLGWRPLSAQMRLALLLAELGLAIVFGCEIVHIRDFMGVGGDMSRMNTVFKFYMIVWIFFAVAMAAVMSELWPAITAKIKSRAAAARGAGWKTPAAAAGVLALWAAADYFQTNTDAPWFTLLLALCLLGVPWAWAWRPKDENTRRAWSAVLGAAVFATALYPPVSVFNRMKLCSQFKFPTLNGTAYLARMNPQDAKALAWINDNLRRTDIVLEAPGQQGYNCFDTRVAIFTGQPTLIGWVGEEEQMRYNPALTGSHTADANRIFGTADPAEAARLMERYQVKYVYMGANERKAYPPYGLDKFRNFMDTVYDQDGVAIYQMRGKK